jgi:hypothetical protein
MERSEDLTFGVSEESLGGVHSGSIVPEDFIDAWALWQCDVEGSKQLVALGLDGPSVNKLGLDRLL